MLARKLLEIARLVDDRDDLIIECDGYELEPYELAVDEHNGQLVVRCYSLDDEDAPGDDDDDEEEETGSDDRLPWIDQSCDLPERPIESLDISEPEPKEG